MRPLPVALAGLVVMLAAAVTPAAPLTRQDLAALARAGLVDDAIVRLVEAEGLAAPLGASDVLALREAGLSAGLLSRLVLWGADDGIRVEERDGVLVVTGSGVPSEGGETSPDVTWRPPPEAPEPGPEATPLPPAPLFVQAPALLAAEPAGYPVGATFGWSGGALFLPAHFGGDGPSAFGRTLVSLAGPDVPRACGPPIFAAPVLPTAPAPHRRIPIRTSRGTLWVPN